MGRNGNDLMVPVNELRWTCDPDSLGFEDTTQVQAMESPVIAQERAVSALKFGMQMGGNDYNVFVAGGPRTGLTHLTRTFLQEYAREEPEPQDWVYVHNFHDPDSPQAVSLPKGQARELAKDMEELIENLTSQIPEVFESDNYRHRREEMVKEFTAKRNMTLGELENKVKEAGFILNMSQEGMMVVPGIEGRPMTEEDLEKLDDNQKAELRTHSETMHEEMNQTVQAIRRLERDLRDRQKELDRRVALNAVGHLIDELQEKYEETRQVLQYLVGVKSDVIRNLDEFKQREQQAAMPMPFPMPKNEPDYTRYKVNVFIDNTELEGAPVVYETNPTYTNLMGAMERRASFGALFTDFTMIRPGSIHKANGGYLVIQARDLLNWYISWEAMKRALKNREIAIEDPQEMFGMITTKGMKPQPIPLNIKIILIGEPYLYHMLYNYDDQFRKLFKVKAHLDDQVDRDQEELNKYNSFVAQMVKQLELRPVDKTGLARLLEYGAELAGRQKKLTLKMALVRDILREAEYWADEEKAAKISRDHVDQAIKHKKFRSALPEEKMQEHILDGYVNVNTTGTKTGQINGLSVFDLGDYSFGRPSRITAGISLGRQGVVAIDRESKMSGNIHTKGVLIMEGYLRSHYTPNRPLSLSASLVFEQSYGMVDGDSASAAELYVLLSALADVPLRQDIAATGAISQIGEVQPVGGVNQKIEGFFEVCQARGLTGEQGVIIPKANVPDLMLKGQVIDAVRDGKFHVYAISTADQALEILTGMPAGERGPDGAFPENSFNRLVEDKLTELSEQARKLMKDSDGGKSGGNDNSGGCDACGGTC
jgi:lon-related putative ATP-dependent protease